MDALRFKGAAAQFQDAFDRTGAAEQQGLAAQPLYLGCELPDTAMSIKKFTCANAQIHIVVLHFHQNILLYLLFYV